MTKTLALALSLSTAAACTDDAAAPIAPAPEAPADMSGQPEMNPGTPVAGTLDTTFGTGGMRALGLPGYASSITRQGDKLVVCANELTGYLQPRIARFTADGALDKTFGSEGIVPFAAAGNFVCERIEARNDGAIVAMMRLGTQRYAMTLGADGKGGVNSPSSTTMTGYTLNGDATYTAYTSSGAGLWTLDVADVTALSPSMSFSTGGPATANRVFVRDGVYTVTGVFQNDLGTGWGVYRGSASSMDPAPKGLDVGLPEQQDLLHDTIMLRDGSAFLVGGVDSDVAVMTAVFAKGQGVVETHKLGAASTGRGVVLDISDRPIVVGSATIDGMSHYMWQRYEASGLAIDAGYAGGGVMESPALSGSGELVSAVRMNGAIYALATNDAESGLPSVGLVKIVE